MDRIIKINYFKDFRCQSLPVKSTARKANSRIEEKVARDKMWCSRNWIPISALFSFIILHSVYYITIYLSCLSIVREVTCLNTEFTMMISIPLQNLLNTIQCIGVNAEMTKFNWHILFPENYFTKHGNVTIYFNFLWNKKSNMNRKDNFYLLRLYNQANSKFKCYKIY